MTVPLPGAESTSSEDNDLFSFDGASADFDYFKSPNVPDDPGDIIDGELVDEPSSRLHSESAKVLDRPAKSGVPNIDEWMDFFSRILIRLATDFYIDLAFRGIDEDLLSEREVDRIRLDKEKRDRIARPFAEFSNKNKFTRKHGREIIGLAGSIDALAQLGVWFSSVNRIAAKYRRLSNQSPQPTVTSRDRLPNNQPVPRNENLADAVRGGESDVSAEQGTSVNGHRQRPDIIGQVWNPGS